MTESYPVVFDDIIAAEQDVRLMTALAAGSTTGVPLHVTAARMTNLERARTKLYALVDRLTEDEMRAYGEYRIGRAYHKAGT